MKNESIKKYRYKIVKSGRMLEVYAYEDIQVSMPKNYDAVPQVTNTEKTEEEKKDRSEETKHRAKINFRRLIEANANIRKERDKFLTLTFAENMRDRLYALSEFKKFIYKTRRKYGTFEYIAVIEHQKRGAIHFHCMLFGFPYIPKDEIITLQRLWKHGSIELQAIKDHFKLQNYLSKYFMKTFDDTSCGSYEKRYLSSNKLKRSDTFLIENGENLEELGHEIVEYQFNSSYVGNVKYKKLKIYKGKENELIEKCLRLQSNHENHE